MLFSARHQQLGLQYNTMTFSIILMVLAVVEGRGGPRHPTVSHHHYHPQPSAQKKFLKDEEVLHDKQHIAEDLGEWAEDQYAHYTDEEIEFRYFKVHDLDNNTKLDGLEIYQAIKHSMESSASGHDPDYWADKESTIVKLIDQVLEEDDLNNDGYLSYVEYIIGRQKEKQKKQ